MLPTSCIESLVIIVETPTPPSKSKKSDQEPFIRVLTPVELMDSNYLSSPTPTQNLTSADSCAEPHGAASVSLSPQQFTNSFHNLMPATTPAFSSYRSMFQSKSGPFLSARLARPQEFGHVSSVFVKPKITQATKNEKSRQEIYLRSDFQKCSVETDEETNKSVAEFGCQMAPSVSYQECQTESKTFKNASCQTDYNQQSVEIQTTLEVANAECQVSPISASSQSNQTEQDILNPVTNSECQAVVEMDSKLVQAETETMEVASQCKPSGKNKAVQMSGACCSLTEKRISKQYEQTIKEVLKAQATLLQKHPASFPEKSKEIPDKQLTEDFTAENVDRLINRFNRNLMEAERNREELCVQVQELTQQVTFSISSLNTTQNTDYFEDDILESSNGA